MPCTPAPGMGVARAQIQALDRHAVAEVREERPKEELAVPRVRAAAEIATDEVRVHRLELVRRDDATRQDPRAEARGETLDACIDAIGECLGLRAPAAGAARMAPASRPTAYG